MDMKRDAKAIWVLVKDSLEAWTEDYAPSMGAALAYYTLFSIAPLLIIVIAVVGFFFGQDAAQGQIFAQLRGLIGPEGAASIQGLVRSASRPKAGAIASAISVVTLLVGATTVFSELQTDLNRIWKVPPTRKKSGLWKLLRERLLTFGMVLGVGFLLLVSLVISAGLSAVGSLWAGSAGWEGVLEALNFVVSVAVATGLFALMYKLLPNIDIGWRDVWIGSGVTALLFAVGKSLIGLYLGKSGVVSGYGAAGSLVVLLLWVYYSAQIFLVGAEFTWIYAHRYGSCKDKDRATQQATAASTRPPAERLAGESRGAPGVQRPPSTLVPSWSTLARTQPALAVGMAVAAGMAIGELFERVVERLDRRGRL